MPIEDVKAKWFLRSRAIQAAIILLSQGFDGLAAQAGIALPTGVVGYIQQGLDAITGDQGLGAILLDAYAGALVVWGRFRADSAKLTLLPASGNAPLGRVLPLVLAWVLVASGCAHATRICDWHDNGTLARQYTTSTVVGTGDTEIETAGCEAFAYSTHETGFSDNARVLLPEIAGKIASAVVAGTGLGAAGGAASALGGAVKKAAEAAP